MTAQTQSSISMPYSLKTIFDRFEKDKAVLITPWGQELFWPKNDIPVKTEPGEVFKIKLENKTGEKEEINTDSPFRGHLKKSSSDATPKPLSETEKETLAKKMLEELLNESVSK